MLSILIIIPSFEPDEKLLQLLEELSIQLNIQENSHINTKFLIVDDGSGQEYAHIFDKAKNRYGCILLKHAVNLGKGRALKTAFNYYLNELPNYHGVVTADSDGQHSAVDIVKCINEFSDKKALILGSRDFSRGRCGHYPPLPNEAETVAFPIRKSVKIPFKSYIGNTLTRSVFGYFFKTNISDTQTGLRVVPTELVKEIIVVPGERFEYEMNMLAECAVRKIPIKEVPIETIYTSNNKTSHFKALVDSAKIYGTLLKYALASFC